MSCPKDQLYYGNDPEGLLSGVTQYGNYIATLVCGNDTSQISHRGVHVD